MKKTFKRVMSMVLVVVMLALMAPAGMFTFSAVAADAEVVTATVGAGKDYATINDAINGLKINEAQEGKDFKLVVYGNITENNKIEDPTFRNNTTIVAAEGANPVVTIPEKGAKSAWWLSGQNAVVTFKGIDFSAATYGFMFSPRSGSTIVLDACEVSYENDNTAGHDGVFYLSNGDAEVINGTVIDIVANRASAFAANDGDNVANATVIDSTIYHNGSAKAMFHLGNTDEVKNTTLKIYVEGSHIETKNSGQLIINQIGSNGSFVNNRTVAATFVGSTIISNNMILRGRAAGGVMQATFKDCDITAKHQFLANAGKDSDISVTVEGGTLTASLKSSSIFQNTKRNDSEPATNCDIDIDLIGVEINLTNTSQRLVHNTAAGTKMLVNVKDTTINSVADNEAILFDLAAGSSAANADYAEINMYGGNVINHKGVIWGANTAFAEMHLNIFSGEYNTAGAQILSVRGVKSVTNIYGGKFTGAGASETVFVSFQWSSANIYGGEFYLTNTHNCTQLLRHNFKPGSDAHGGTEGPNTEVVIYGGTFINAGKGAVLGAGTSNGNGHHGNITVYGGTFVNANAVTGGYGIIGHKNDNTDASNPMQSDYYFYGGTWYCQEGDMAAYKYTSETDPNYIANAEGKINTYAKGQLNQALENGAVVTPLTNKTYDVNGNGTIDAGETFANADVINAPESAYVKNLVKDTDFIGDAYFQKKNSTYRVLFEIKTADVEKYDNIQFWVSSTLANPLAPIVDDDVVVVESAEVHTLYKNVIANGETVSASEGYAFAILTIVVQSDVDNVYVNAVANGYDGSMTIGNYATIQIG